MQTKPFDTQLISDLVALSEAVFDQKAPEKWINSFEWRLNHMPDVTVCTVEEDGILAGFKIGYAEAFDRYYSWLGGVHPRFRERGLAEKLMREQHDWLESSRFYRVETKVAQDNIAMIALNTKFGMQTSGMISKNGKPYLLMERIF